MTSHETHLDLGAIKIKISQSEDIGSVEGPMGEWLLDNPAIELIQMTQSESSSENEGYRLTISLLHKEA